MRVRVRTRWTRPATTLLLSLSLGACSDATTGGEMTTGSATTDAATGGSGGSSTGATEESTGTAESTTSTTGGSDEDSATETGVVIPPPKSCALAVIDPGADVAAALDEGDAVGQIPTIVGDVLLRNCGCHYTDNIPLGQYVDYKSNKQPLATLSDFHGNFMGIFPTGYEQMPAYLAVEQRVVFHEPLPMPSLGCGTVGEPGTISAADLATLADWLAAGAPDGASWPGR